MPATLVLDCQNETDFEVPAAEQMQQWAECAIPADGAAYELAVRIVDAAEGRSLNQRWRGKDKATNVLSFPCELPLNLPIRPLGDVVLCAPVVAQEAEEQGKSVPAHWAHLLVHGILHLTGYDHDCDADARHMEQKECEILAQLGFPNPYL